MLIMEKIPAELNGVLREVADLLPVQVPYVADPQQFVGSILNTTDDPQCTAVRLKIFWLYCGARAACTE